MTFSAIVTSHQNPAGLRNMLGQLRYQTRPPDETLVFCSDTPDLARFREHFPDVTFTSTENMEDWGHAKRAQGLREAKSDFCGFFNDDDRYSNAYVELMMREAEENPLLDVVYCPWNTIPDCGFGIGSSTSGNFIFRVSLGRTVGYQAVGYEADGQFIEGLRAKAVQVARLEGRVLYFHNEGVSHGDFH